MARPPDQETTAFEKTVCYSQIPRGEKALVTGGHTEKLQGQLRSRSGNCWQRPLL